MRYHSASKPVRHHAWKRTAAHARCAVARVSALPALAAKKSPQPRRAAPQHLGEAVHLRFELDLRHRLAVEEALEAEPVGRLRVQADVRRHGALDAERAQPRAVLL